MLPNILFLSIDGMSDPLGQSQVIPYLVKLSEKGFPITIISCEKKRNFMLNESRLQELFDKHSIKWVHFFYSAGIPLVSQWKNFKKIKGLARKEISGNGKNTLLHCRNLMMASIGLSIKKATGCKLIFDTRGFWADERIEGKIWKLKNPVHKKLYSYFKKKETELLSQADHIITLTHDAASIIAGWMPDRKLHTDVIPCCADTEHFTIRTEQQKAETRKKTGIGENDFVIGYLGSLGTWYMPDEMLDYFACVKKIKKNAVLFFVTPDTEEAVRKRVEAKKIAQKDVIIKHATRNEVPELISIFDLGLFFIRPTFSKRGSSPTKLAELLACGIPVVTNKGVGDVDTIVTNTNCGILVNEFSEKEYAHSVQLFEKMQALSPQHFRNVALNEFSLEKGVEIYAGVYHSLAK